MVGIVPYLVPSYHLRIQVPGHCGHCQEQVVEEVLGAVALHMASTMSVALGSKSENRRSDSASPNSR